MNNKEIGSALCYALSFIGIFGGGLSLFDAIGSFFFDKQPGLGCFLLVVSAFFFGIFKYAEKKLKEIEE